MLLINERYVCLFLFYFLFILFYFIFCHYVNWSQSLAILKLLTTVFQIYLKQLTLWLNRMVVTQSSPGKLPHPIAVR